MSICLVLALAACGQRTIALDGDDGSATTSTTEATSSSASSSSSTGESDSDTSTDDGSEDPSAGFVTEYDLSPAYDDCSVFDQDCPEDYKCVPSINSDHGPSRCVAVLGDHGVGEPCEYDGYEAGTDDCDANSHCWAYNDDEPPYTDVCRPLCNGSPDAPSCPGQGETCISYSCHILGQVGIPLCELNCDPLAQACGEGLACAYNYGYSYFGCTVVGEAKQIGEVCEWEWSCAPGLQCVDAQQLPACDGPGCCTPYCAFGDDQSCADQMPGTVCTQLPVSEPVEGCPVHGMCTLP